MSVCLELTTHNVTCTSKFDVLTKEPPTLYFRVGVMSVMNFTNLIKLT